MFNYKNKQKITLVTFCNENILVIKTINNFEKKNKKILLGEIYTDEIVIILEKFQEE